MTNAELLFEAQNLLHSSSDEDNMTLLKDILDMAVYERVMYADNAIELVEYMYDADEIKDFVTSTKTLAELAEDYCNDDVISFIKSYMNDNAYEMLHWMANGSIMAYVKHHIKINDYLSGDLED